MAGSSNADASPAEQFERRVRDLRAETSLLRVLAGTVSCLLGVPPLVAGVEAQRRWRPLAGFALDGFEATAFLADFADRIGTQCAGVLHDSKALDLLASFGPLAFLRVRWGTESQALLLWPVRSPAEPTTPSEDSVLDVVLGLLTTVTRLLRERDEDPREAVDEQLAESAQRRLHALHEVAAVLRQIQSLARELKVHLRAEASAASARSAVRTLAEESSIGLRLCRAAMGTLPASGSPRYRMLGSVLGRAFAADPRRTAGRHLAIYGDHALVDIEVHECLGTAVLCALEAELLRDFGPLNFSLARVDRSLLVSITPPAAAGRQNSSSGAIGEGHLTTADHSEPLCLANTLLESLGGSLRVEGGDMAWPVILLEIPLETSGGLE